MNNFDTTGRRLPLPKARYEAPEPWMDADQKQLLQFLKTPTGTKFLLTPHDVGIKAGMSVMLGMIENRASETDSDPSE